MFEMCLFRHDLMCLASVPQERHSYFYFSFFRASFGSKYSPVENLMTLFPHLPFYFALVYLFRALFFTFLLTVLCIFPMSVMSH